ncbi:hypothetical protein K6119_15125 [Paracrocinitomix mangrovi]|uniref:hypothetical protein n=1 Tax=Paracrocinitomix mangrovi TaxID=2862509 RepID=UPI001C8D65BA|nr:hypothetical protein [Paracrocinitomix mangrovi]UKN01061.1 hypothetical protein K6119_15125 [Paracrocinitomix mangrovi]
MRLFLSLFVFLFTNSISAQVYIEGGNTRHRFAQLNLGLESKVYLPLGTSAYRLVESGWVQESLDVQFQQNIVIGGTHFWGHADFYISIPTFSIGESKYRRSVETGAKFYPWRIEHHKLKPFVELAWAPSSFGTVEGSRKYQHEYPIGCGVSFSHKNFLFELSGQYVFNNQFQYATSISTFHAVSTPKLNVNVGVKWIFDSTLGAEENWKSGRTKLLTDTLSVLKKLSGFTLSAGPSSSIFIGESNHNTLNSPYIHEHRFSNLFAELGIGYYWFKPDMHFNIAFRGIRSKQKGFGLSQLAKRQSLALETTKFLFDYHGFVPFIGVCGSYEWLNLTESSIQDSKTYKKEQLAAGVVFGWDIRPDHLQSFYLRTTLRWYPNLKLITAPQSSFSFSQMEFNFITLVIMVDRLL